MIDAGIYVYFVAYARCVSVAELATGNLAASPEWVTFRVVCSSEYLCVAARIYLSDGGRREGGRRKPVPRATWSEHEISWLL